MVFIYIAAALILIIAIILFSKIRLRFYYKDESKIEIGFLFLKFNAKKLAAKFGGDKNDEKKPEAAKAQKTKKKKGSFRGFIKFLGHITRVAKDALIYAAPKVYIDFRRLNISVATDDAAKTALIYGASIGAANALLEALSSFCNTKFNDDEISMKPNFAAEKTSFEVDIIFKIRVISILKIRKRILYNFYNGERMKK